MIGLLLQGILETKVNFIAAAAGVCTLTALVLVLLTRNLTSASPAQRRFAAAWVSIVAGVGVWTTHFVAMIGYRPDAALTYSFGLTAASILVGVICVGLPVAGSTLTSDLRIRTGMGVLAGLGVAAMHLTGMSAIQNCITSYNAPVLMIGILLGTAGFIWALTQDATAPGRHLHRIAGFVGGVCGLHFVAMAAVTLDALEQSVTGIGGSFLSILVAVVSLGVLAISVVATFNHRRHLAQQNLAA